MNVSSICGISSHLIEYDEICRTKLRNCLYLLVFLVIAHMILATNWARSYDDVIEWKHFPHNWPFVRGIHRSPVNSLHKGQWRGVLMISLIGAWINDRVNNREAGDLRRHRAYDNIIVMVRKHIDDCKCPSFCMYLRPLLTLIPTWLSKHIQYNMLSEINYPFPNFNGFTVEVC